MTTTESRTSATLLLRLTSTHDASCREVEVTASTELTWSELRPHLEPFLPLPPVVYAGGQPLADHDLFGSAPLLHGAVLTDRVASPVPRSLLEVVVAEGPDAGATHPLGGTSLQVGRVSSTSSGVLVADPDVSRRHALLEVAHGRVQLTDLASTNGTRVDDAPVEPGEPVDLRVGQRVRVGSSTLRLRSPAARRAPIAEAGRVPVHRAPRDPIRLQEQEIALPVAPDGDDADRLPWLMVLIPIPVALVMAVAMRSTMMLAFGLMSPVMMLGQYLHDRRSGRHDRRRAQAAYAASRDRALARCADTVAAELALRRGLAPDLAELRAVTAERRVWPRRPTDADHLWWRVGTGDVPVGVTVRDSGGDIDRRSASGCPVTVSLEDHRVVGLSGPARLRTPALEALVGQLAVLHSPLYLRLVVVLADPAGLDRWRWARRLPHLNAGAVAAPASLVAGTDDALISRHLGLYASAPEGDRLGRPERHPVHTVVILDGAQDLAGHPVVSGVLTHGALHHVSVVAVDASHAALPSACEVTVDLDGANRGRLSGEMSLTFCPDLPHAGWASTLADDVVPLLDATPGPDDAEPPTSARLLDLLPDVVDADRLAQRWAGDGRTTRALLGLGADGSVVVDLASDGPHALVGGTTGSGKSELLQTLIASLAVGNRPDEMVFVLVDYKGGAAFKDCARLPHTVGLVTDLDAHLTERALTSLDAEVRRRERLLGSVGAKDLEDHQRIPGAEHLPRLVLVIDEFRVLAEELPDFIDGLVRIAAVGRSLGIHLVLATQRPGGVVSTDIRANVNLRIALRVRDAADSDDVVDSPVAAGIPTSTPGRAVMRSASAPLVTFQAARVGGHGHASAAAVTVRAVDPRTGRVRLDDTCAAEPTGPTDLQRLVDAALAAARVQGVPSVPSPWLPSLPPVVELGGSDELHRLLGTLEDDPTPPTGEHARLGVVDLPHLQRQDPLGWDLTSGHLAVIGGQRSGRTTAVRTVVTDAARRSGPDDLHVYVVDSSGSLGALGALPHTGAVVGRDDEGAGVRLMDWLLEEVASRQNLLAADHHTDLGEHRAARHTEGRTALPRVLVVIDGWDAFGEAYELIEGGRVLDTFHQVLRDGVGVGVHLLLTGGRGLLSSRVAGSLTHRLCLRTADEMDLLMAGLRPTQVPADMPAGRALLLPDAHEVQLALLTGDRSGRAQAAAVAAAAATMPPATHTQPRQFSSLPDVVAFPGQDEPAGWPSAGPVLGLAGDDLDVARLPSDPAGGLAALVCGPAGSGRTTALVTLASQLRERPVLWLSGGALP
ncbi:FtsK/SpoIIIE domain-containing protein, partial [Luteipulveratus flavus]